MDDLLPINIIDTPVTSLYWRSFSIKDLWIKLDAASECGVYFVVELYKLISYEVWLIRISKSSFVEKVLADLLDSVSTGSMNVELLLIFKHSLTPPTGIFVLLLSLL